MADKTKKKTETKKTSAAKNASSASARTARSSSARTNAAAKSDNAKKNPGSRSRSSSTRNNRSQAKNTRDKKSPECKATTAAQRDCKLTDYDIISDVLGSHKSLIKLYGTALCEIGSEDLRDLVSCQMAECAEDQFDAFNYMNARGMYPTEPAPVQKVKQARQKFSGSIKK